MEQANMKVNFKTFRLYLNVAKTEFKDVDAREIVADLIYQNTAGIAGLDLAQKIYKSDGEIELNEREISIVKSTYPNARPIFIASLNEVLK